jgi:hypothetical protein
MLELRPLEVESRDLTDQVGGRGSGLLPSWTLDGLCRHVQSLCIFKTGVVVAVEIVGNMISS